MSSAAAGGLQPHRHAAAPAGSPAGRRRALVVAHYAALRLLFRTTLEEAGFSVATAGTPAEAAPYVCPDLTVVVLDLELPARGGPAMYRQLQAAAPNVPVVVLHAAGQCVDPALQARVTELVLPFDLKDLEVAVLTAVRGPAPSPLAPSR